MFPSFRMLKTISGNKSALCNPTGWCTDMAGANVARICNVFGNVAKTHIKSCKFHFKDHRNKKASKLDSESSEDFKVLCVQLLESVTKTWCENIKQLDLFISSREGACQNSFRSHQIEWRFSLHYIHYDKLIIGFPFSKMGNLYEMAGCRLIS